MQNKLKLPPIVLCLMGPTASGKTSIALELAQHLSCEIISVDSAMIYRAMDIGTAKPTLLEQSLVVHHLIDIIDPIEKFSVAKFCVQACNLIAEIHQRNKIPLLVGGTMMYFNALQQGLSVLPDENHQIRQDLFTQMQKYDLKFLYDQLQLLDPVSAQKINCNDQQRIFRALEVFHITQIPLSQLQQNKAITNNYKFINITLFPEDRSWLHQRIEQRFAFMLQHGFLEEVQDLMKNWPLTINDPAIRCVGYRQAYDYLLNNINYVDFYAQVLVATRQLAKRQLTWLRSWSEHYIIACDKNFDIHKIIAQIISY